MNRTEYSRMFQLLVRNQTKYTECIKITRTDGVIFRFTAHDANIVIREHREGYEAYEEYQSAASFSLTNLETSAGLLVSNMDIDGIIDDDAITEAELRQGKYDNAQVEIFVAYWADRQVRVLPLRTCWIGELQVEGSKFKVDLRGIAQRLAQTFIKGTSLECRHTFADGGAEGPSNFIPSTTCGCRLSEATYTSTFTITDVSASSKDTFHCSGIPEPQHENYYQWGKARFTSGNNSGTSMEILFQYGTRVKLFLPMPFPILVGTTVELVAGCNKTYTACGDKFGNRYNFGGEPFLAGSDLLTQLPTTPLTSDVGGGKK